MLRELQPGTIIADRYRIGSEIGRGGCGIVYEAVDEKLDRPVALKAVAFGGTSTVDTTIHASITNEARLTARDPNPHVVQLFESGTDESYQIYFITMERLKGEDLDKYVGYRGSLSVSEAVAFGLQAADGVASRHRVGIIHRDLKPANLFVANLGEGNPAIIKVLDFGVSVGLSNADSTLPLSGPLTTGFTPTFAAPEQLLGRDAGCAADVFSLAATIVFALTGARPFPAESDEASALSDHFAQRGLPVPNLDRTTASFRFPSLRPLVRELSPELDLVLQRALAWHPQDRYQDAKAFAEALKESLNSSQHSSAQKRQPRNPGNRQRSESPARRKPIPVRAKLTLVLALTISLAIPVVVTLSIRRGREDGLATSPKKTEPNDGAVTPPHPSQTNIDSSGALHQIRSPGAEMDKHAPPPAPATHETPNRVGIGQTTSPGVPPVAVAETLTQHDSVLLRSEPPLAGVQSGTAMYRVYTQGMSLMFVPTETSSISCAQGASARAPIQGGWETERPVRCHEDGVIEFRMPADPNEASPFTVYCVQVTDRAGHSTPAVHVWIDPTRGAPQLRLYTAGDEVRERLTINPCYG
jgi:serine/threonine protein kinase